MTALSLSWSGKTIVVKVGGAAIEDERCLRQLGADIAWLVRQGVRIVVIHGGGPQIDAELRRSDLEPEFVAGFRRTTPDVLDVVKLVLTGRVRPRIVEAVAANGVGVVGLSGQDGGMLQATPRSVSVDGIPTDIGLVGDVHAVDAHLLKALVREGYVPVVSTIASTTSGAALNVNADSAAAAIAEALEADRLIVLTDVAGLYERWPETDQVVESIDIARLEQLLPALQDGIAPKMEACLRAVRAGVSMAHVVDGREPHALLTALDVDARGTKVVTAP